VNHVLEINKFKLNILVGMVKQVFGIIS